MARRIEFFFDLVSPYSYLAYGQVGRICEEQGAELVLRPMLLGAVHKAVGLQAPIERQNKGRYQLWDIHRWAKHYGLPMQFPEPFPFRTLKTMRAALAGVGDLEAFTREAFALYWEEGGAPKGFEEADEDGPIRRWRAGSVATRRKFWRAPRPVRPKKLSRARPARPSRVVSLGRRPSSSGTRCSGATTGCTSWRRL